MRKILVVILVLVLTSLTFVPVTASEITIKSISPSEYYDSRPVIWDDYIVWRRAINQNENSFIELSEPSWIMVHRISSGESWNITPINMEIGDGIFHHAEAPDIWNDKIIYEAQVNGNSSDTKLFMYNVSSGDTWRIPIKSTQDAHGHLHRVYGDWVAYTHKESGRRQLYLYNYEDGIFRTVISKADNYTVYGMEMHDDMLAITLMDLQKNVSVMVYDVLTTDFEILNYTGNHSKIYATSIHGDKIGLTVLKADGHWCVVIYDTIGKSFREIRGGAYGLLLWKGNVAFMSGGDIYVGTENNLTNIPSRQQQILGDMYEHDIVWMDNRDSSNAYGDARDNFDIYVRTVITDEELFQGWIILMIIIIIGVAIVVVATGKRTKDMV